jgi:hypothetical protein
LRRSTTVICAFIRLSERAAANPPKPAPMMTIRGSDGPWGPGVQLLSRVSLFIVPSVYFSDGKFKKWQMGNRPAGTGIHQTTHIGHWSFFICHLSGQVTLNSNRATNLHHSRASTRKISG